MRESLSFLLRIRAQLDGCSTMLKHWSSNKFGKWRKQLERNQKQLEKLYQDPRGEKVWMEIRALEKEIERLNQPKEAYWKQRSRSDWLGE